MHPILSTPTRLRAFVVAWVPVGLLLAVLPFWWVSSIAGSAPSLVDPNTWVVGAWGLLFAVPVLASWYVCRFAPINVDASRVFATIGTAAVVTSALWLGVGRLWFWAVSVVAPAPDAFFSRFAPFAFAGAIVTFVVMSAVHYALAASDEGRAAVRRALESDVSAREAELRALRAQVDPHFLFNCLHSISALVGRDPVAARRMCLELAEFFRDSLRAGSQPRIPIGAEAALVRRYLDIERVRFGDRLRATVDVAPDVEGALVPPLLLQPLAENAVRHGIATLIDGGDIRINISRRGDRVQVNVDNPYDADGRRPGTGVGLTNVRERLETFYGGAADLRVDATGSQYSAAMSFPLEESA